MDMPTRRPLAEVEITASLYFWWLAFLRCSKDYWWCCQQGGQCMDERLVQVWKDFGDIFKYQCFIHSSQCECNEKFCRETCEMRLSQFYG